jgi:hypothetical protein
MDSKNNVWTVQKENPRASMPLGQQRKSLQGKEKIDVPCLLCIPGTNDSG